MKNILFIMDYYLPNASPNGICCRKIVNELKKENKVTIVCFNDKDKDETIIEENLTIHKIYDNISNSSKISYYIKWLIPFTKYPPYTRKEIVNRLYKKVVEVKQQENIDIIVCVHLPIESLIVGKKIKEQFDNITCVAYMLDSLSGGLLPSKLPKKFTRQRKIKWEQKILENFDKTFLIESSRQHHIKNTSKKKWYKKAKFVDIPMIIERNNIKNEKANTDSIKLLYAGGLFRKERNPKTIIKALELIDDLNISCEFIGDNDCIDMFDELQEEYRSKIIISKRIPYEEIEKKLTEADILINIGGKNTNLIPSKLFEYMSYCKPIISTYESKDDPSLKYLSKYPYALLIDGKEMNINKEKIINFINETKEQVINAKEILEIYKKNTPGYFIEQLMKL